MALETSVASPARTWSLWRIAPLAALLAVPLIAYLTGWYKLLSFDLLAQYHGALKAWIGANYGLAVLAWIAAYAAATALSLPVGLVMTVTGGVLFGVLVGVPATVAGATLGAVILFLVARSSLGTGLAKQAGPWLEKLSEGFQKDAFNYLLFLRLVPAFPFFVINLVPAILGMRLWPFVLATVIGIVPATIAFTYAGVGLESVILAATQSYNLCLQGQDAATAAQCKISVSPGELVTPQIIVAFVLLALVALIPIAVKRIAAARSKV